MKISTILQALATGELSNLFLANDKLTVKPDKLERVLATINLGLTDIYTRFFLKRKSVIVTLQEDQRYYTINQEDLIEIVQINSQGYELTLNVDYTLINYKTILLHSISNNSSVEVIYKANHKEITKQDIENDTNIELPTSHLNLLLYFSASRLYTSIVNQLDGDLNESVRYTQKYLEELSMLTNQGIDVDNLYENSLFKQRGFI